MGTQTVYDVIVVGSGASGGVAAYALQTIISTPRQTRAGVEIFGVKRYLGDVKPSGVRF